MTKSSPPRVGNGGDGGDGGDGARNPATAMATTFLDELARGGVAHVVVCPGSRSTALAIAAARTARVTVHVRHDERSAAFTALGIGRASGLPAAVVTTSGTAVANLLPAAAEADIRVDLGNVLASAFEEIGSTAGHSTQATAEIPLGIFTGLETGDENRELLLDLTEQAVTRTLFDAMGVESDGSNGT